VQHSDKFERIVNMYVYEEIVDGRKLTEIINTEHENVKYLPGHRLPENVVAVPDVAVAADDADILVFVLPHQFIANACKPLVGKVKSTAFGVSLCKVTKNLLLQSLFFAFRTKWTNSACKIFFSYD
jgi:glycerol-3-phosphate dehydrogenase (NAD+)